MLIPARKRPAVERLYAAVGRQLLRRTFAGVWIGGAEWPAGDAPVIAYLNHGAWWDPVLAVFLSHDVFRCDGYGVMDGEQLRRYPFFRTVGCFGVEPSVSQGARDDVRALAAYAAELLRGGQRRALWIFPQGALLPGRPVAGLRFRSGLARIARAIPDARLVPVAVRYEFRAAPRPECRVRVGPWTTFGALGALTRSPGALTRCLEEELSQLLAALDADLARSVEDPLQGDRLVLRGGSTVSRWYDRALGR